MLQLLEFGAAVDAVDSVKGRTALHRAIKGSVMMYPLDAKIVTLLLESGASPFSADNKGLPAIPAAARIALTVKSILKSSARGHAAAAHIQIVYHAVWAVTRQEAACCSKHGCQKQPQQSLPCH